jgi:hypothetical protein
MGTSFVKADYRVKGCTIHVLLVANTVEAIAGTTSSDLLKAV